MATNAWNISRLVLCNAPIDPVNNQLDFSNQGEQVTYFNSISTKTYPQGFTYLRKESTIDVPDYMEDLAGTNYCYFLNPANGTGGKQKYYFAFIDEIEYLNPETSRLHLRIDSWQTYQFDCTFGKCFVEREHTDVSNSISIEEGLDAGNAYVLRKQVHLFDTSQTGPSYYVAMTETVEDIMQSKYWDKAEPLALGGTPHCVHYYLFDSTFRSMLKMPATDAERNIMNNPVTPTNPVAGSEDWWGKVNEMSKVLNVALVGNSAAADVVGYIPSIDKYNQTKELLKERAARFANAIIEIFRIPADPTHLNYVTDAYGCRRVNGISSDFRYGSASSGVTADYFSDPKLNTFPYSYFKLTNHKGSAQTFKPEYVSNPHISYVLGFGSPVTIRYWCDNYQGSGNQKDQSVISNTNNTLPVLNDQYGAYLMTSKTQNDVAVANSVIGGAVSAGTGLASAALGFALGGPAGALIGGVAGTAAGAVNGLTGVYKQVSAINAKKQDLQGQPPTVSGNSNSGDFDFVDGEDGVWVELWTINDVQGSKLADYFNRFGYEIDRVKVPNFKGRANFNFIKTTDCLVKGGIPLEDLNNIRNMFNNGITMWHNPWNVGNF